MRKRKKKTATRKPAKRKTPTKKRTRKPSRSTTGKTVFFFGGGKAEGRGNQKDILGGKGAGLAEMTNAGLPVPPGFTISTAVCRKFLARGGRIPPSVNKEMEKALRRLEKVAGQSLGSTENPLLVSVRSGSAISMPGMMDTILNLGLNDKTVETLARRSQNPRFAWDCYRRLIQMFGDVAQEIPKDRFDKIFDSVKQKSGAKADTELTAEALREVVAGYKELVANETGKPFPQDPKVQFTLARDAVFRSWNNQRAVTYRRLNGIPNDTGTAVNVQQMVFGNLGKDCGTGVAFTRNPSTGEKEFYGEYLQNAQGEDVVAGIRTPVPMNQLQKLMPKVYKQLVRIAKRLERHYRDMQDFEFTIQAGKLYMLQTRAGTRTGRSSLKIAFDMAREKLISRQEAVLRVDPSQLEQLLHPVIDDSQELTVLAKGLPASPGAAVGRVVFSADAVVEESQKYPVILVRKETVPDDIHGMDAAAGILTTRGGITSHAAVVARGMGKCCIVGCDQIQIHEEAGELRVDGRTLVSGDWISLDGNTGRVILGQARTEDPDLATEELAALMQWAGKECRLGIRANADIPRDARVAREFGAEGIGLCRTEHMFFAEDRLPHVRAMILADTEEARRDALDNLLPMQRNDFKGLFRVMDGLPVTIRLLDPPLNEFLPQAYMLEREIFDLKQRGDSAGIRDKTKMLARSIQLHEQNPMLGTRGCRLGILYPEISEMQARAIFEAACDVLKEDIQPVLEIMIPLVGNVKEFTLQREVVDKAAREVFAERKRKVQYLVGTMIELPRAVLTADEIAQEADFFSFGTNDLTQTTLGLSRDDTAVIIQTYLDRGIFPYDPFQIIDFAGVGKLVEEGTRRGRSARPKLKVGICGEHGGEPASVEFCHRIGLDYVSCSPYRVPVARLAAAHAALKEKINR